MLSRRARAWRFTALVSIAVWAAPITASAAGNTLGSCPSTADKPQSKIWYNDASYWAVLQDGSGSHIFRLVSGAWQRREDVDPHNDNGAEGHEDVLWNGQELFVLVYSSSPKLYKFTYQTATDTHALAAGFPVDIPIAGGSETLVLDQDSTGRLWAAYEGNGNAYAAYSTSSDHRTWQTPGIVLRDGLNDDDIATVIHFGNKIGVFWSDQNRWEFGFRTHSDGAAPESWSSVEVVRPGVGNSDDHLNLCADSAGRVYAITKDVENLFAVHRRDTNGSWTTRTDITGGQTGTRPVLVLDATETKLYAAYTCWSCGTDPILYRVGSTSSLSFGSATTLLSAAQPLNDVTDMKQKLPPNGFMAIAHGGSTGYWDGWGTPPSGNGFGDPGNPGEPPPPPPPVPPGAPTALAATAAVRHTAPGIAACYSFDEAAGNTVDDDLDTARKGTLGATGADTSEPTRTTGIAGGALRFDGANDYVEVPAAPGLDLAGSFTLEAWVRRTTTGGADVVLAKEGSAGRNYRLSIAAGNVLELSWKTTSGSTRTATGVRLLTDTQWHHVAAVHDQAASEDRLYVDGGLDARRTNAGAPGLITDPLWIGARRSSGSVKDPLAGDIDLVRLASTALYGADFTPPTHYDLGPAQPYVLLAWGAPSSGDAPTGYWVSRSMNAEDYALVTPTPVSPREYLDLQAEDGILRYVVRATNAVGDGPNSTAIEVVFGAGPQPPQLAGEPAVRVQRRRLPTAGNAIWPLDDGTGSASADVSAFGHALILGGPDPGDTAEPAWIAGVARGALHFDGLNDHARADDGLDLRYAGSFTVETWVRVQAIGSYGALVAKESSSAGRNYRLAVTAAGKIELQWKNTAGATHTLASDAALTPGTWHHAAGVFDAATGESRVFLDGRLAGRKATAGAPQTGDASVRLGARQSSSSLKDFFAGDLDLARVSGEALYASDFTPPPGYGPRSETWHWLAWGEATPGSARLVGYTVQRSIDGGAWTPITAALITARTLEVPADGGLRACYRVTAVDRLALASAPAAACTGGRAEPEPPIVAKSTVPIGPRLSAGPNPFNPATTITLRLDAASEVEARIYDVRGRCLRTLAHATLASGEHRMVWDGRDASATVCAAGVYFVHVRAGGRIERLKLVLAK